MRLHEVLCVLVQECIWPRSFAAYCCYLVDNFVGLPPSRVRRPNLLIADPACMCRPAVKSSKLACNFRFFCLAANNRGHFPMCSLRSGQMCSPNSLRPEHSSASLSLDPTSPGSLVWYLLSWILCHQSDFGQPQKTFRTGLIHFFSPVHLSDSSNLGHPSAVSFPRPRQFHSRRNCLRLGRIFCSRRNVLAVSWTSTNALDDRQTWTTSPWVSRIAIDLEAWIASPVGDFYYLLDFWPQN